MAEPDLPPTQPIAIIDTEMTREFLTRLRENSRRSDRAIELFDDQI